MQRPQCAEKAVDLGHQYSNEFYLPLSFNYFQKHVKIEDFFKEDDDWSLSGTKINHFHARFDTESKPLLEAVMEVEMTYASLFYNHSS